MNINNNKIAYIGFDFSLNKPAATILLDNKYYFMCWPLGIDNKSVEKLKNANVIVNNRIKIKFESDATTLMVHDLDCSIKLAEIIINDIKKLLIDNNYYDNTVIKIANEGFSFNSTGNSQLQLAGYKYILLDRLAKFTSPNLLFTYAPQTIKSTANCAKKGMSSKEYMISSFINNNEIDHEFYNILKNDDSKLRKKKNFIECIDDIVDSYFTLKTLLRLNK